LGKHISLDIGEREEEKRRKSSPICFRGFRNASVKFPKTLGKHISLDTGESEE